MVDRDRSLVAVGAQVEARLSRNLRATRFIQKGRPVLASVVTDPRPFHLDDVGTQVAEKLSGERGGENSAEVQNAQPRQRAGHVAGFGSRGMPSTRSLMMFFWISLVPAYMVSARARMNAR